jgi:hypothetical protein
MKHLMPTVLTNIAFVACLMPLSICLAQPRPAAGISERDSFSYTFAAFASWAGTEVDTFDITKDKMREFLEDRKNELTSAQLPKWSDWLKNMEKAKSLELRAWSLARRLEAGDFSAYLDYKKIIFSHVLSISKTNNKINPLQDNNNKIKPLRARIPNPFDIHINSVFWDVFEKTIRKNDNLHLTEDLYIIWCFNTHPKQREFIFELAEKVLLKDGKGSYSSVWSDPRYLIIVEWLYSWGDEEDFARVHELLPKKAKSMFHILFKEVNLLPGFFDTHITLPNQAMDNTTISERLTTNDDEDNSKNKNTIIEFNNLQVKKIPTLPAFPEAARKLSLMTVLTLELKIGKDGKPKGCRPKPGPWMALFAPTGARYAMGWEFEPAKENNAPIETRFILNVVFEINPHGGITFIKGR